MPCRACLPDLSTAAMTDLHDAFAIACTSVKHGLSFLAIMIAPSGLVLQADHVSSVEDQHARFVAAPFSHLRMAR